MANTPIKVRTVTQSNLFLAYTRSIPVNLLHGSISSSCLKSVRSDTHTDYPSFFHPLLSQTRLPVWGDLNFGYSELTWSDLTMERNDRNRFLPSSWLVGVWCLSTFPVSQPQQTTSNYCPVLASRHPVSLVIKTLQTRLYNCKHQLPPGITFCRTLVSNAQKGARVALNWGVAYPVSGAHDEACVELVVYAFRSTAV